MITRDLRRAIARAVAAAGFKQAPDPGLRPTGIPGRYAASVALTLGANPRETAATLAATLTREQLTGKQWIATVEVTGPGYLAITVTPEALAAVAANIITVGPACVTSDALTGVTVPAAPPGDPLTAPTWEQARAALAARLTARLAAAAGATVAELTDSERLRLTPQPQATSGRGVSPIRSGDARTEPIAAGQRQEAGTGGAPPREATVAAAVAFAGRDAVTFTLARAVPGKPLRVDPEIIARQVPGNPAYAVRYAHARAASGVRWIATSSAADTIGVAEAAALLDALSWLPERVATAARRGRPDEFARYLEDLASVTVHMLISASHPGSTPAAGSARLTVARAAQTGLAAGLGLLEVSAPERL